MVAIPYCRSVVEGGRGKGLKCYFQNSVKVFILHIFILELDDKMCESIFQTSFANVQSNKSALDFGQNQNEKI